MADPVNIRNFTWDDFDALFAARAVVTGIASGDSGRARAQFRARLELPGANPLDNVFIADVRGDIAGCAIAAVETAIGRSVGEFGVLLERRGHGIGRALLERLELRASEAAVAVHHVNVRRTDTRLKSFMEAAGYRHVRTFNELEYRPAPAYLEGDYRPLPDGVSLRKFHSGRDEPALADVQNAAFEGSFGFAPNTPDQIAGYVAMRGAPDDILIAEDGASGGVVGYIWTSVSAHALDGETSGMIEMTGVRPEERGRGVGTAVIAAGVRHLRERGVGVIELEVDNENLSARRIYRDLGFKKTGEQLWYEKRLTA